jgi:hypothetical protein
MGDRSLLTLQKFVVEGALSRVPIGTDETLAAFAETVLSPGPRGMTPAERLDVYREQFWLRHLPNLEEDFPTVRRVLRDDARFRELAIAYLSATPPRIWDLQRLGGGLPDYLSTHAPWEADQVCRDAARLDWAFMEAFDAPDAPPFDPRVLTLVPEDAWTRALVILHPSLRLLRLSYPVHDVRTAAGDDVTIDRERPAIFHVVVWRDAACVLRVVPIDEAAFSLLHTLTNGMELGAACELLARSLPDRTDLDARVSSFFQGWTQSGWVVTVLFPTTDSVQAARDADGS